MPIIIVSVSEILDLDWL